MMVSKLPAIQFYPGDWRKDPGVQALSFHDRGVWFEIILLMHESDERGKLLLNGKPMPESALARLLGLDNQNLTTTLTTLLEFGVASRCEETGAIICRRMLRDENLRNIRKEAGRKGGNPVLVKQKPTTQLKQKPTPSSSTSSSTSVVNTEMCVSTEDHESKYRSARFVKPTVQDVIDYVLEIGATVDAKQFVDHYEANGWLVGRNKMKDWKATLRGWHNRNTQGNYSNGKPQQQQRKTSAEQREELNASSFDWIRQAAAEASGRSSEGACLSAGTGATLFLEEHGTVDGTRC
jgi:hypothetical protein